MNQNQIAPAYGRKESYFPDDGAIETSYTVCVLPPYHLRPDTVWQQNGWRPFTADTEAQAEAAAMAYCREKGWQYQRVNPREPIYPQIHGSQAD